MVARWTEAGSPCRDIGYRGELDLPAAGRDKSLPCGWNNHRRCATRGARQDTHWSRAGTCGGPQTCEYRRTCHPPTPRTRGLDGGGGGSMLQHYAVLPAAAAREKDHFRPGGAARVVATTIRTIAENKASPTTPNAFPVPAKIKPTSPRGTIPIPTERGDALPYAGSPAASLPKTAATVSTNDSQATPGSRKEAKFTCIPISTKKSGAKTVCNGEMMSCNVGPGSGYLANLSSVRTSPAAKAPTIAASPIRFASHAVVSMRTTGKISL